MSEPLDQLEARIGYTFRDRSVLEQALTHTSLGVEKPEAENNQRLEFLGDAVLQILLAEALFQLFPLDREGVLSKRRSLLVNQHFLARLARDIGIDRCLRLGKSEEKSGGRERTSVLGDAFEALIGAIYLDAGFERTRELVRTIYGDLPSHLASSEEADNPKGRLQELVQPKHGNHAIRYDVTAIEGEDHARVFEVAVFLNDRLLGHGRGTPRKAAEEAAARVALSTLKSEIRSA
ncbi:MAG: ribonuclease III [Opitutus sp.]